MKKSIETLALENAKKGYTFYSEKYDNQITALASVYKRQITTERVMVIEGLHLSKTINYLTKVTILK